MTENKEVARIFVQCHPRKGLTCKEVGMLNINELEGGKINLSTLATLTGFSEEKIREELLSDHIDPSSEMTLEELRKVMLNFIDRCMLQ